MLTEENDYLKTIHEIGLGNSCSSIDEHNCEIILSEDSLDTNQDTFIIPEGSVVLRTMGRLGNQLYQYAAAYSLAQQTESKLYVFVATEGDQIDHNWLVNGLITSLENHTVDINYW